MISLPAGTRIWIVAGVTDMRRGFIGLAGMVQTALQENPFVAELLEPYKSMVLIAALTGLRRGELFALRWGAVDFERKTIRVRESVYEGHFSAPKTRSSIRSIPMGEALEAVLLSLRPKDVATDALVFASQKGTPPHPENILKRIIHPACERLGLLKVGWHDLRHTSATLLHENEPLRVAQAILGHSDLQTTLGYTHVLPGWQREAMKRLEKVVLSPNVPKSEKEPEMKDSELIGGSKVERARRDSNSRPSGSVP
jgi:integrase